MEENSQNKKVADLVRTIAKESIRGSGNRVVLGEQSASIQDALDNGGIFFDTGRQVLAILAQSSIDPYVIYQEALRIKLESKIPRIDFVGLNAKMLDQWDHNTADVRAPIYIRQMQWLKENAKNYGYEQNGNSWVLAG
jgi:hypothetical protein